MTSDLIVRRKARCLNIIFFGLARNGLYVNGINAFSLSLWSPIKQLRDSQWIKLPPISSIFYA